MGKDLKMVAKQGFVGGRRVSGGFSGDGWILDSKEKVSGDETTWEG